MVRRGPAYQTYADGYFAHHVEAGHLAALELGTWADLGASDPGQPGGSFAGFDGTGGGYSGSGGAYDGGAGGGPDGGAGGGSGY